MTNPPPTPPTLCEVTYDQDWDLLDLPPPPLPPPLPRFRAVSSAKSQLSLHSHHSHGRSPGGWPPTNGLTHGGPLGLVAGGMVPPSATTLDNNNNNNSNNSNNNSYYDYLKSYYWDRPSTAVHNVVPSTSPTLPARPGTSQTWCGGYPDGPPDRPLVSLPALSRPGPPGDEPWGPGGEEAGRKEGPGGKLKWVDALNAWIPEKQPPQRHPYINFINTPPRVERLIHTKEEDGARPHGEWPGCRCTRFEDHMRLFRYKDSDRLLILKAGRSSQKRGNDEQRRKLQRKAYSSPLYDPETLRKSRTVRFEAPRTASNSPQPIVVPEQIEVPLAVLEDDTTVLEGESFELGQAEEGLQEQVVMVVVREVTSPVHHVLDPPPIVADPVTWPQVVEESVPTPEPEPEPPEPEVVEAVPEEELIEEPPEEPEPAPVATSSPRQPTKASTPRPLPVAAPSPIEEPPPPPILDSSSSESMTPPPVQARRPTVVEEENAEETEAEKGNLVGLMSRLSSLQRAKPKPKPKKERPPPERTPRPAPKPKPVEKPPPAPPKPVRQPKPPPPKPVKAEPRPPKPPPKEKKIVPKPAPKPPPPMKEKKEKPKPVVVEEEPVDKPVPLPISPPEEIKSPEPVEEPPPPPPVTRVPVKKKEKLPPPPPRRRTPTPPPKPPTPVFERKEREDWIFGSDEEKKEEKEKKEEETVTIELPSLPLALPTPSPMASPRTGAGRGAARSTMNLSLVAIKSKPRWGQKQKDSSVLDEEERERLAEERRRRHAVMMERYRMKKGGDKDGADSEGPNFEDWDEYDASLDGFLAKYCILNPATTDKYKYTFEHLDEGEKGFLTEEETAYGLRAINPSLSVSERTYLFRILEMAGHKMKLGTDFRLFSILAALSQRVSRLDEWARKLMAEMDYKNLEMKLFLCKRLWECNVDPSSNTISLDQLIVELRAGGVSPQHEGEVRTKLADHRFLDFFDFLMYVPLFIMIHETVVTDPLSNSRTV